MKNLKIIIVVMLCTIVLSNACVKDENCIEGEGPIVTETLNIPDFTGIELEGAYDIVITQGAVQEVIAEGHANIIDRLNTTVSGGNWKMGMGKGCFRNFELTIYITVPTLDYIEITGAGEIDINGFDSVDELSIKVTGSGVITGQGNFTTLDKLDINITGHGEFYGFPMETDECDIRISGSGTCEVYVNNKLDVDISGAGNIYYKGNPTVTQNITGAGAVIEDN